MLYAQTHTVPPSRAGQTMILLTVLMGSMLMMATAVVGLYTFYELQQSKDVGLSTTAIFAADAGLERGLRFYYYEITADLQLRIENEGICWNQPCTETTPGFEALGANAQLGNGATYSIELRIPPANLFTEPTTISATGRDVTRSTVRSVRKTFSIVGL